VSEREDEQAAEVPSSPPTAEEDLDLVALMDEGQVDAYVQASHRFVVGLEGQEEGLAWNDLLEGREALYSKTSRRGREPERRNRKE